MGNGEPARLHLVGGDERFVQMYERYFRHVYAYCRRRTEADQVDDVVADVFLVAWRRIEEIPDPSLPWLYGVAFRVLGQQWRGSSRKRKLDRKLIAVGVEPVEAADEVTIKRAEAQLLLRALDQLKPKDQEILRLSVWEELDYSAVADVLGLSEEAVRQRSSRARRNLTREFNRLETGRSEPPAARKGGAK